MRKFLDSGGATLDGRLVDIDTGNAIANADIEAWMGTRSVEAQSDAEGHFKIEGLVPGSRIMLWITAAPTFVQERTEVAVPPQRPDFQGTFRMLNRTAVTGTVDGGAGLFLTRRGSRTLVTGLAAFGPAERGGVRVGDSIVSVGKRKVGDLGPGAIDYLLRGPIGSQVEISVQTDSNPPRKIMYRDQPDDPRPAPRPTARGPPDESRIRPGLGLRGAGRARRWLHDRTAGGRAANATGSRPGAAHGPSPYRCWASPARHASVR